MASPNPPGKPATLAGLLLRDLLAGVAVAGLFVAADGWWQTAPGAVSVTAAIVAGLLAGFYLPGLFHEWGHYLGGALQRAPMALLPLNKFPAVYHFDYPAADRRQFLWMSLAGNLAGLLAVSLLWLVATPVSPGQLALACTAVFFLLFTGHLEAYAIASAWRGTPAAQAIKAIPDDFLLRCGLPAAIVGLLLFALQWGTLP